MNIYNGLFMKCVALCLISILHVSSVQIVLCKTRTDIDGTFKSITVAGKSGHWAFATIDQKNVGHVYLNASSGQELWHLNNLENSKLAEVYNVQVKISETADAILVVWQGVVNQAQLYHRDRSVLFDKQWNREFDFDQVAADGSLLFYDKVYLPNGTVESVTYPDDVLIPPHPEQTLLNGNLIALTATVKRDTISSITSDKEKDYQHSGRRYRRPPRGILSLQDERVFYLIRRNGTILHRQSLGVSGGAYFTPLGKNMFLVESIVRGNKQLQLMQYDGARVWQIEHPTGHLGDNSWYGDDKYILLASTYSSEFFVIDARLGRETDRKKYLNKQRIGSVISMFREADRIIINRYAVPVEDRPQMKIRTIPLLDGGKLGEYSDSRGLKFDLPGEMRYLIYSSADEKYGRGSGVSSTSFRLNITEK